MSFLRTAVGVFSSSVAGIAIGIGTSIVLARWLSVEDRGVYSVATNFVGLLGLLLQLGWPSASIYRLVRVRSEPAQVASAAMFAALAVSGVTILATVAFAPQISSRFLADAPSLVLLLAMAVVPFQIVGTIFAAIARGIDRFGLQNWYRIVTAFAVLVATVAALVLAGGGVVEALLALLASQAVVTLVFVALVLRQTGLSLRPDFMEVREGLRFGLKSYLQSLAGQMHERVDIFLLAYLMRDPEQVAIYAIAVSVIQRLKLLPDALGTTLLPRLASQDPAQAARFTAEVCRHSLGAVIVMSVAMAVAAPIVIPLLFGDAYRASVVPFLLLLPGMALYTIYRVIARYFTAVDRQQPNITTQVVSLAANVVLNLWLIPRYGIVGSALASLISYSLESALILLAFRVEAKIPLRDATLPRWSDLHVYRERLLRRQRSQ